VNILSFLIYFEILMPIFHIEELVKELHSIGVNCKVGDISVDIPSSIRPYFERWLFHRDGFIRMCEENIDYIGIEDIVRMGPFYNVYCLIEDCHIIENDDNAFKLLCANPYFDLYKGKVTKLGWSGGILAEILTNDIILRDSFAKNIMKEMTRKISIKVANYACIIETQIWQPTDFTSIYEVIDCIGSSIKELLKQVHLGYENELK
jgi:hypothetical protein